MTDSDELPESLDGMMSRFAPGWPAVLDVSAGWHSLLSDLDRELSSIAREYVIEQVKSKFGILRVYASPSSDPHASGDEFQDVIHAAERRSAEICEECGEQARQYVVRAWVATLCDRHAVEASQRDGDRSA